MTVNRPAISPLCASNADLNCSIPASLNVNIYFKSWTLDVNSKEDYLEEKTNKISVVANITGNGPLVSESYIALTYFERYAQFDNNPYYQSDWDQVNSYYHGSESYFSVSTRTDNKRFFGILTVLDSSMMLTRRTYYKFYEIILILISLYLYIAIPPVLLIKYVFSMMIRQSATDTAFEHIDLLEAEELLTEQMLSPEKRLELIPINPNPKKLEVRIQLNPQRINVDNDKDVPHKKTQYYKELKKYYESIFTFWNRIPWWMRCVCRDPDMKQHAINNNVRYNAAQALMFELWSVERMLARLSYVNKRKATGFSQGNDEDFNDININNNDVNSDE